MGTPSGDVETFLNTAQTPIAAIFGGITRFHRGYGQSLDSLPSFTAPIMPVHEVEFGIPAVLFGFEISSDRYQPICPRSAMKNGGWPRNKSKFRLIPQLGEAPGPRFQYAAQIVPIIPQVALGSQCVQQLGLDSAKIKWHLDLTALRRACPTFSTRCASPLNSPLAHAPK